MALDALRCNHLAPLGFKGLSCRVRQTRVFDDGRSENFPACTWLPSLLINKFTRQKRKTKSSATADIARDADVGAHSRSL